MSDPAGVADHTTLPVQLSGDSSLHRKKNVIDSSL